MNAELAARRTAAAAMASDFRRVTDDYLDRGGERPDWSSWAFRLVSAVSSLLDVIGEQPETLKEARGALLGPAVTLDEDQAATVLSALEDASEHIRERAANCPECMASPADLCDGCSDRLNRAGAYDALAGTLREATS